MNKKLLSIVFCCFAAGGMMNVSADSAVGTTNPLPSVENGVPAASVNSVPTATVDPSAPTTALPAAKPDQSEATATPPPSASSEQPAATQDDSTYDDDLDQGDQGFTQSGDSSSSTYGDDDAMQD